MVWRQLVSLLVLTELTYALTPWSNKYSKTNDIRMLQASSQHQTSSYLRCCLLCDQDAFCMSASYRESTSQCELSPLPLIVLAAQLMSENGWTSVFKDSWYLVFRGMSGNNIDVYHSWSSSVSVTTDDACAKLDDTSCSLNYRNPIIDMWSSIGVNKVKFALYQNGNEVAHVTFDGTGSNLTSWFTKETILESTWTDLTLHDYLYFSIEGMEPSRRFYICVGHGGCDIDPTYTLAVTSSFHLCDYDKSQSSYPQFIYSTTSTYGPAQNLTGLADFMAVFIK